EWRSSPVARSIGGLSRRVVWARRPPLARGHVDAAWACSGFYRMKTALTISGSDSGAGAGIQADLKTFAALGVYGTCAITAITAQNTQRVSEVFELPPGIVAAQIDAVVSDIGADAVKPGMLSSAGII